MKYIATVQLKTQEELLQDENVSMAEDKLTSGIIHWGENGSIADWIAYGELSTLGQKVDIYLDERDDTYDIVPTEMSHGDDLDEAIYGLMDYTWVVKEN